MSKIKVLHHIFCAEVNGEGDWIQIMKTGEFKHDFYGEFKITKKIMKDMVRNFKNNVRQLADEEGKPVLDIDYEHKSNFTKGGEAAGWIKALKVVGDALMAKPEWTVEAKEAIEQKVYMFFSPEFVFTYEDGEGNKFENVLLGGGLTNRPFLKGMDPITLEESRQLLEKEENSMDKIKVLLEERFGIKFTEDMDANAEAVKVKLDELHKQGEDVKELQESIVKLEEKIKASGKPAEEEEGQEENKEVKELSDRVDDMQAEAKGKAVIALMEKASVTTKKVTPAACKEKGWFFELANNDIALAEKTLADLPESGLKTDAVGSNGEGSMDAKTFDEKVEERAKADKIPYDQAAVKLMEENNITY